MPTDMVFIMALRQGCISFNATSFTTGLKNFAYTRMPEVVRKGLYQTGWMIIRYANEKKPYTPRDIGDLRASGRVEVEKGKLELIVGFNKEYAARWHELPKAKENRINWTTPGSGRKYLETKLYHYKNDFMRFMAEYIRANAFTGI